MNQAQGIKVVKGNAAIDGAGVHLVRVLGHGTTGAFDPILMLDSFDSTNPEDYIKGFPMHPHRGIETITYLSRGQIDHEDSLGNKGSILNGDVQWMTAGSGILHQEMPQPSERMLGLQFWLNLPQKEKMTHPKYFDIKHEDIPVVEGDGYEVRVISGEFEGVKGVTPHHIPATFMDVRVKAGQSVSIPLNKEENAFLFTLLHDATIGDNVYEEKSAVLLSKGDVVTISADEDAQLVFVSAKPLGEPIAWGGPIVMNTREELQHAFKELQEGTFIKEDANH